MNIVRLSTGGYAGVSAVPPAVLRRRHDVRDRLHTDAFEQRIILDALEEQLRHEPTTETRNRKRLGENELSDWELRVQKFRVFYDVVAEDDRWVVKIKAVGHKEHDQLYVGGREVRL